MSQKVFSHITNNYLHYLSVSSLAGSERWRAGVFRWCSEAVHGVAMFLCTVTEGNGDHSIPQPLSHHLRFTLRCCKKNIRIGIVRSSRHVSICQTCHEKIFLSQFTVSWRQCFSSRAQGAQPEFIQDWCQKIWKEGWGTSIFWKRLPGNCSDIGCPFFVQPHEPRTDGWGRKKSIYSCWTTRLTFVWK